MFEDLRDAGFIYIFYECLSIFFTMGWILTIVLSLLRKTFFENIVSGYLWPLMASSIHHLGLIIWMELVEVRFMNCDSISDRNRQDV